MAAENHYMYTGEDDPPEEATHVTIHESITVIPDVLFSTHENIIEVICHDGVLKIEGDAFSFCPRLKRLVMNGVEEVEGCAFRGCSEIKHFECKKLKIIRSHAFEGCTSLGSIDLSSAEVIEYRAFRNCKVMTYAKFGQCLETIGEEAFYNSGLGRITIPLKSNFFIHDSAFTVCDNLKRVDLLEEGATLQLAETIEALPLREWKKDMWEVIDSINETLLNTNDGSDFVHWDEQNDVSEVHWDEHNDGGEVHWHEHNDSKGDKARRIEEWIAHVFRKINYYKVEHRRFLTMAATELAYTAANDIVIDNALSFLQLPLHAFDVVGVFDSGESSFYEQYLRNNALRMGQKVKELQSDNDSLRRENDEKENCNDMLRQKVARLEQQLASLTASSIATKGQRGS